MSAKQSAKDVKKPIKEVKSLSVFKKILFHVIEFIIGCFGSIMVNYFILGFFSTFTIASKMSPEMSIFFLIGLYAIVNIGLIIYLFYIKRKYAAIGFMIACFIPLLILGACSGWF
jgi:hypothetical protein